MGLFDKLKGKHTHSHKHKHEEAEPPSYSNEDEPSRQYGKYFEASEDEFAAAQRFIYENSLTLPKPLTDSQINSFRDRKELAYKIVGPPFFRGSIEGGDIIADQSLQSMLFSNLPLVSASSQAQQRIGKGVYYEVEIVQLNGIFAIGFGALPLPPFRMPGWERLSVAVHSDDGSKFWEDPNGGKDFTDPFIVGEVIGVGFEFAKAEFFIVRQGQRRRAFEHIFRPLSAQDIYAAIGIEGNVHLRLSFGGEHNRFKWKEAEADVAAWSAWKQLGVTDDLPAYGSFPPEGTSSSSAYHAPSYSQNTYQPPSGPPPPDFGSLNNHQNNQQAPYYDATQPYEPPTDPPPNFGRNNPYR